MEAASLACCTPRLAEWIKAEPERRRKLVEERRKRLEKRRAEPKHYFDDPAYMQQIKATEEGMDDALRQGGRRQRTCCMHTRSTLM